MPPNKGRRPSSPQSCSTTPSRRRGRRPLSNGVVLAPRSKQGSGHVMSAFTKAAKKVTARRFAKAAVIAALVSMPGAAQQVGSNTGTSSTMPDNCKQNLDQCSQKVWMRNSFPRAGTRQSITFSNGTTLTCTSNGPNKLRSCTLKESHGEDVPAEADTQGKKQ